MINKAAIFAGAVGGVAPNFLRLIVNYSSPSPQPIISAPIGYCLAIAGFAVLRAVAVWVFQETDLKRAFYVGDRAAITTSSRHIAIGAISESASCRASVGWRTGFNFTGFFSISPRGFSDRAVGYRPQAESNRRYEHSAVCGFVLRRGQQVVIHEACGPRSRCTPPRQPSSLFKWGSPPVHHTQFRAPTQ